MWICVVKWFCLLELFCRHEFLLNDHFAEIWSTESTHMKLTKHTTPFFLYPPISHSLYFWTWHASNPTTNKLFKGNFQASIVPTKMCKFKDHPHNRRHEQLNRTEPEWWIADSTTKPFSLICEKYRIYYRNMYRNNVYCWYSCEMPRN